jgi:hypothetical protein
LQPSLFTRLAVAEAELLAMKDILAELKVNQDELRRDRDEWRWGPSVFLRIWSREPGGDGVTGPLQR